jgi:pimeloyl-ACP methyl ester carboxylesterase/LmbE family N-acetylglucosaminyl deacetylase
MKNCITSVLLIRLAVLVFHKHKKQLVRILMMSLLFAFCFSFASVAQRVDTVKIIELSQAKTPDNSAIQNKKAEQNDTSYRTAQQVEEYRCPCSQAGLDNSWADSNDITCYSIPVNRNYHVPQAAKYFLAVAIAKSTNNKTANPLLYLHGGPGIATLDNLPRYLKSDKWQLLRRNNDIIFFDYRGTGYSQPSLCDGLQDSLLSFSLRDTASAHVKNYELSLYDNCRNELIKQEVDLSTFNSFQLAADAEEIRKVLGINTWNVYGVSYGTTIAFELLRSFPKHIKAAVIDSPFPPNAPWSDFIRPIDTAFKVLQKNVLNDPLAAKKFSSIQKDFAHAVERLNKKPVLLSYKSPDSSVVKKYYTGDDFAWSIWRALLNPKFIPLVPLATKEISNGNDAVLQQWSAAFSSPNAFGRFSEPQSRAILCFEGRPRSYEDTEEFLLSRYPDFASFNNAYPTALCNIWRPDTATPNIFDPVSSDIPVLILAGEYDPVTPPLFGKIAAETLSNSTFVLVPSASHAAMFADDCLISIADEFLRHPKSKLSLHCVNHRNRINFITENLPMALKHVSQLQAKPNENKKKLPSAQVAKNRKILLAIVAHPDDEMAIADVLVKYARLGHKVVVMIATNGKGGTRVTSIPEGDSLGKIRQQESICACKKMGIEPPVFLSVERLDTKIGVRNYFNANKQFRGSLVKKIPEINPNFIITFGPDGDSHHAEHVVTGSAVTEVLLQQDWVDRYPLYYIAYTKQQSNDGELGYMKGKFINVEISYTQEDELKGLEANKCYTSQMTAREMEEDYQSKVTDTTNKAYFRRFVVKQGVQKEF